MPIIVQRGELYSVNWNPARGSEQAGERPALIIQNDSGNKISPTTIVAACSTAPKKPYPFLVHITRRESGLPEDCTIDLAVIITIDKSRLVRKLGWLSKEKMLEVDAAIKVSLGLQ